MIEHARNKAGAIADWIGSYGIEMNGGTVWMKVDNRENVENVIVFHRRIRNNNNPKNKRVVILEDGSAVYGHRNDAINVLNGKTGEVIERFKLGKAPTSGNYQLKCEAATKRLEASRFSQVDIFYWTKNAVDFMLQGI